MPGANRSMMPPRTAYSPGSRTVEARRKPLSSSQLHDAVHRQHVAGRGRRATASRSALAPARAAAPALTVVSRIERPLAALQPREPRQRGHALRDDAGMRRDAVVGLAVPGRELEHRDVGREERERARRAAPCAARRGRSPAGWSPARSASPRSRARDRRQHQALGAVGHAGERQRPAGHQQLGGGSRHSIVSLARSPCEVRAAGGTARCRARRGDRLAPR